MKNEIRTIDLIKYFENRVEKYLIMRDQEQALYDAEKLKFDNSIWHKWFGADYATKSVIEFEWADLYYYRRWVNKGNEILNQLEYRTKCGYEITFWEDEWNNSGWNKSSFYNWCKENNIPY